MVWVIVSKKVAVQVRRAKGRITYVLVGSAIRIRNNTHPLVTTHFNTPLSRTRLVPHQEGAQLVVQLREDAQPSHRVVDGPRGMMVLQVILPKATRTYAATHHALPLGVGRTLPKSGGSKSGTSGAKR